MVRGFLAGTVVAIALVGGDPAGAQLIPTTTTTTTAPPESTTTTETTLLETTTTATTAAPAETTTTAAPATTATTGAPATTETTSGPTSSTFAPPEGVSSTTAPSAAADEEVLVADTDLLPLFVTLSLGGLAVALVIVTAQWIRTRPSSG